MGWGSARCVFFAITGVAPGSVTMTSLFLTSDSHSCVWASSPFCVSSTPMRAPFVKGAFRSDFEALGSPVCCRFTLNPTVSTDEGASKEEV